MHGWFQKLFKSRVSSPAKGEQGTKETKNAASSVHSKSEQTSSASSFCSSSSSSSGTTLSKSLQSQSALCSPLRWSRKYDVFVCHSCMDSDNEEAGHLVSFLEASPYSLRCFLRQRDDCPGSAISTELCQAVQDSHIWALLITPNFLQDEWCKYMMHQVLAEGPMSNRIIPLIQNLSHSQYPQELKFFFYINLSHNPERAYTLLSKTVLKYFEDLVKNQKAVDCNMSSPSNRLGEEDSSQKDKMMTQADSDGTTIPFSIVTNQTDGSFSGDS